MKINGFGPKENDVGKSLERTKWARRAQ